MLVIGVTGAIASGKGTAALFFESKGYFNLSLTDELRTEVEKRNLSKNRENFLNVGDDLRKEMGVAILAERIFKKVEGMNKTTSQNKFVIDGLKNPGEILFLKDKYKMFLIGIRTTEELRLKRLISRASTLDQESNPETIKTQIERDLGIGQEKYGNNIQECLSFSDVFIDNNNTIDQFKISLEKTLIEFESRVRE